MQTITAEVVKCISVKTKTGEVTLRLLSRWEGMEKWADPSGRYLIMAPCPGAGPMEAACSAVFSGISGDPEQRKYIPIMASPDLAAEIDLPGRRVEVSVS